MRDRKDRKILWLWAVSMLLIVLVFATGVLDKQKVWPDVQLDCEKKAWRLEDGDTYGIVATGPYYSLPVGRYRIKWQIEGDGENRMMLSCSNDAIILDKEITIQPNAWEDEAWFEIKEPTHSFFISLEFSSGSYLNLYNIRLYSPFYSDQAFTFAAAVLALCLLLTLYACGRVTPQGIREGFLLAAAVVFASLLSLQENSVIGHDTQFHAARILNLADGLRSGQLPVRVGGFSYNGYGAMTSVFYPDLLLYPWAMMILGGASMSYVINTLAIAVNAVTAACIFICACRLLRSRQAGLCASILYMFSIYRMGNIYMRYALGEMLAMAFLPLFLLGLYEVVQGNKQRWPVLVLGATLVFRSHMLTTLMCAGVAAVTGVLFLKKIIRERRLASIGAAIAATVLINLNQIVPMVMCYLDGVNTSVTLFGIVNNALNLLAVLAPQRSIGMALIIGVVAFVCADAAQEEPGRRFLWLVAAAGAAFAVLSTDLIPWSHIVILTDGLAEMLQFPWRFLLLTSVCFALVGGDGLARLLGGRGLRAAVCTLALGLVCTLPYIEAMPPYENRIEFGQSARTYMIFPEYQIEGTDPNNTRSRHPILTGDVVLEQYEKDGTRVTAQVRADGDAQVTLPMFGFPGYAVTLNDRPIDWTLGENNRLTVSLPAGTQGTLRVGYAGKAIWKVMDVISAASALGLAAYVLMRRKVRQD